MPVRKFRSVEEMPPPPEAAPFAPDNLRLALALSRTCIALHPLQLPRGVHKHRSVAAAGAFRRRWEEG